MTFQIERLARTYSVEKGEHFAWRKLRGQPEGKVFEWGTKREAEGFMDLLMSNVRPDVEYRVVEAAKEPA